MLNMVWKIPIFYRKCLKENLLRETENYDSENFVFTFECVNLLREA